ncbi:MAG TPA: Rid family hydrolase [Gemmatimonadales bacterium]|nr:Rid family hydrolase [Gemmatimonadales bacterium]
MSPRILAFLLLVGPALPRPALGQASDERAAVLAVVHRLFDAMRAADSAAVRSVFHPSAQLATAIVREGNAIVNIDTLEAFIGAVGSPHAEVWDERLRNEIVQVDGTLATVWAEYSFYAGDRFSHCGVDAFQLAKTGGGWRIVAIADTRRRQGCPDVAGGAGGAGAPEYHPMPGNAGLPFSEAVRVGNLLYLAGQLGTDSTGRLVRGGIGPETRQAMQNIRAVLERHGSSLDRVVRCLVMLADVKDWASMNKVYVTYFPRHLPARSALGASGLALGARVEIECTATLQ